MKSSINELQKIIGQQARIKKKKLPAEKSLNDILVNKNKVAVTEFLKTEQEEPVEPTPVLYQWPKEEIQIAEPEETKPETADEPILPETEEQEEKPKLEIIHEHKLLFKGKLNQYYVLGSLSQDLGAFPVTLIVEDYDTGRKERVKIDLYEREVVRNFSYQTAEAFNENPEILESEIIQLTDLLETFRDKLVEMHKVPHQEADRYKSPMNYEQQKECIEFLQQPNLIERIDKLIEQTGVVGEESTRKLLYIIASTYKMNNPLHSLVQGTSGSGKSHLINIIGQCFPPEDVMSMTRVTSKSFYHYSKDELVDKLILIQDYDGLDEEAQYAFRELQSAGNISSSTTYKDRHGNLTSAIKTVRSHFASLLATTKAEVYYDNMSRSVVIGVDESDDQTLKIIQYQNKKLAGIIDQKEELKAKQFLQNLMRCIKAEEVVNKFADKVFLPFEAKMLRRLNSHYQAFVKQITILHQYQRKRDGQGRLIAEPEDLKIACDILFDSIMLKVDDLDSSLRQFFDKLKAYIKKEANGKEREFQFTQRDARLALNASKATCFRYMEDLELLEYIQKTGGYANRGFKYKIVFWDDMEKIREKIKTGLNEQLNHLENHNPENSEVQQGSQGVNHQDAQPEGE